MIKKVIHFINEAELIPPVSTKEFIEKFCEANMVDINRINNKKTNYARGSYKNQERLHISLCKFALYFFMYHRFSLKYREVAEIINPESPVKRPTSFYYISRAEDFISIGDTKFLQIYYNTINYIVKYANTSNKGEDS